MCATKIFEINKYKALESRCTLASLYIITKVFTTAKLKHLFRIYKKILKKYNRNNKNQKKID